MSEDEFDRQVWTFSLPNVVIEQQQHWKKKDENSGKLISFFPTKKADNNYKNYKN